MFLRNDHLSSSRVLFELLLHFVVLCILSNEVINWLVLGGSPKSDKLGLSILFGIYSVALTGLGIWTNRAYLRIAAIVFFGATLVKLSFMT